MITKYIITFPVGRAVAGYNEAGTLVYWEVEQDLGDKMYLIIYGQNHLPTTEASVRTMTQRSQGRIKVSKMLEDVSFDNFWNTYAHKVGKRDRCVKLWNALTHIEKAQVLHSIPVYKRWLSGRSIEMVYPDTYLAQRRWENDFK